MRLWVQNQRPSAARTARPRTAIARIRTRNGTAAGFSAATSPTCRRSSILPRRPGRSGRGFAFGANAEQGFDPVANVVHQCRRPRATGGDLERVAHVNRDGERPVHRRLVGQIFLQPLERFEHPLRARVSFEIARRIERKLLRQGNRRELVPAPLRSASESPPSTISGRIAARSAAHPRGDVAFPLLDLPLAFSGPRISSTSRASRSAIVA